MTVDTIIDLDSNKHYLLLDETSLENRKFFYAVELTEDCQNPTNNFCYFEEVVEAGEHLMYEVVDKKLSDYLLTVFANNYLDSVTDEETSSNATN